MSAVPDKYQTTPVMAEKVAIIPALIGGAMALYSGISALRKTPKLVRDLSEGNWRGAGGTALSMGGDALFAIPGLGHAGRGIKALSAMKGVAGAAGRHRGMAMMGNKMIRAGTGRHLGMSNAAGKFSWGKALPLGMGATLGGDAIAAGSRPVAAPAPTGPAGPGMAQQFATWAKQKGIGGGGPLGWVPKYKRPQWLAQKGTTNPQDRNRVPRMVEPEPVRDLTQRMGKIAGIDMRILELRRQVIDDPSLTIEARYRLLRELDMIHLPQTTAVSSIVHMLSPYLQAAAMGATAGAAFAYTQNKFGAAAPVMSMEHLMQAMKARAADTVMDAVVDAPDYRETTTERATRGGIRGALLGGTLAGVAGAATGTPDTALARALVMGTLGAGIGVPVGIFARGKRN